MFRSDISQFSKQVQYIILGFFFFFFFFFFFRLTHITKDFKCKNKNYAHTPSSAIPRVFIRKNISKFEIFIKMTFNIVFHRRYHYMCTLKMEYTYIQNIKKKVYEKLGVLLRRCYNNTSEIALISIVILL